MLSNGALQQREMNTWIGPSDKRVWNVAIHVLHIFGVCHKCRMLPLRPIQHSSPSNQELQGQASIQVARIAQFMPECTYCGLIWTSFNAHQCIIFVFSIQLTVNKIYQWLDSNQRHLVLEAAAVLIQAQHCPDKKNVCPPMSQVSWLT